MPPDYSLRAGGGGEPAYNSPEEGCGKDKTMDKFEKWIEKELRISEYLSRKENWTPIMKRIAKQFLVVGFVLGCLFGCSMLASVSIFVVGLK